MPYSRFCDVDCGVTRLRIGENDRFFAGARSHRRYPAQARNASEAPQFQELRRHSQSSPLTTSHTTRPIHTQEVTGSSPVAPTIPLSEGRYANRQTPPRLNLTNTKAGSWRCRNQFKALRMNSAPPARKPQTAAAPVGNAGYVLGVGDHEDGFLLRRRRGGNEEKRENYPPTALIPENEGACGETRTFRRRESCAGH